MLFSAVSAGRLRVGELVLMGEERCDVLEEIDGCKKRRGENV
jgi:hypothetical protein